MDQTLQRCLCNGVLAINDVEFAHGIVQVKVSRAFGQTQQLHDFSGCFTVSRPPEAFDLTRCQAKPVAVVQTADAPHRFVQIPDHHLYLYQCVLAGEARLVGCRIYGKAQNTHSPCGLCDGMVTPSRRPKAAASCIMRSAWLPGSKLRSLKHIGTACCAQYAITASASK